MHVLTRGNYKKICYSISMDIRKKAAKTTIEEFTMPAPTLVFKNIHVYSDSDTSSYGGQDALNSKSPSPASLRDFINALPHFEPLHFGIYLLKGDKRPSCLCLCARGLTPWRTSFHIDMEKEEWCKCHLFQ